MTAPPTSGLDTTANKYEAAAAPTRVESPCDAPITFATMCPDCIRYTTSMEGCIGDATHH